jgi:DNA-binding NarL/FixJ family response regulator
VRAVIADDNTIVREGLSRVLSGSSVEVVGCAATPEEALDQVAGACPDVLFLGARMASSEDYALVSAAKAHCPHMGVIAVSWGELPENPWAAVRRGVSAWLSQGVTRASLVLAAKAAVRGYVLLETQAVLSGLSTDAPSSAPEDPPETAHLTPREMEVLALVSQGLSNREIASRLTVSVGTVQTHMSNILSKLGLHDRVQAALWFKAHSDREAGLARHGRAPRTG